MPKKHDLTDEIVQFIKENYLKISDANLGKRFGVPRQQIHYWRKKLGLADREQNKKLQSVSDRIGENKDVDLRRLSLQERREFFLGELKSSPRFAITQAMLTEIELAFYTEKYIEYCTSPDIETLAAHEKDDIWFHSYQ